MRCRVPVTVVVLCVCVCVCVCLSVTTKSAAYLVFTSQTKFYMVLYGVFKVLPFGFPRKCFIQEFWHHLLVTAAFLAPWWAFDGQTRQWWLLFNSEYNMVGYRSNKTTGSSLIIVHWQRSLLAISTCYKLLTQHCTRDTAGHYTIVCNVHSCGYSFDFWHRARKPRIHVSIL